MRRHILLAALAVACLSGAGTRAQDALDQRLTREACTPVMAVQKAGCALQKFFHCDVDGVLYQRAESIDETGGFFIDFADANGNTIQSVSRTGYNDTLEVIETRKLFSNQAMMAQGGDDFDYTALTRHPWFKDPVPQIFKARLAPTGRRLEIDGVDFVETRMIGFTQINNHRTDIDRYEYIDLDTGVFVWGGTVPAGTKDFDQSTYEPMRVYRPGEPEFQFDRPIFDCGAISLGPQLASPKQEG